jgi:hypothetical protein
MQYLYTFTYGLQKVISEVVLNPSFQGGWDFLELKTSAAFWVQGFTRVVGGELGGANNELHMLREEVCCEEKIE